MTPEEAIRVIAGLVSVSRAVPGTSYGGPEREDCRSCGAALNLYFKHRPNCKIIEAIKVVNGTLGPIEDFDFFIKHDERVEEHGARRKRGDYDDD